METDMKQLITTLLVSSLAASAWADSVGVSITVGEPGFYGHINIGDFPQPRLVYREPLIVDHVHVIQSPVYLHVPPGHAKHWQDYCHEYGACNRPVYFVEEVWYEQVYVPEYRKRHGHPGKGHGKNKSKSKQHG
jgi:hypothetical protein